MTEPATNEQIDKLDAEYAANKGWVDAHNEWPAVRERLRRAEAALDSTPAELAMAELIDFQAWLRNLEHQPWTGPTDNIVAETYGSIAAMWIKLHPREQSAAEAALAERDAQIKSLTADNARLDRLWAMNVERDLELRRRLNTQRLLAPRVDS